MEGVSEHWNLRFLVDLMGKMLWPWCWTLFLAEWGALATEASVVVWSRHVSVPNKPLTCTVRLASQQWSYQRDHSCQRRRQTALALEDIRSFIFLLGSCVAIEERYLSPPAQACRLCG